ncbi:MAG: helix-turn-helix transcriptional regulator [Saprospiraceae bacterium]
MNKQPIPYQYNEQVFLIRKIRKNFDAASIDEHPHRHNFYEFLYIQSGEGKHEIDGITYDLKVNTFHIISKGQVHQFLFAKEVEGYLIRFKDNILPAVLSPKEGYYYNILHQINQHQDLTVEESDKVLVQVLLKRMLEEYKAQTTKVLDLSLIQHLLYPLLILMHRHSTTQIKTQDYQQNQYIQFITLLEEHYKQHHVLEYYAPKLGITKRQLSLICQEKTGKTAKQLINERILTEAKRLLKYTTLSLKEISDRLGFNTLAYFCRRFKIGIGKTPSEYKRKSY